MQITCKPNLKPVPTQGETFVLKLMNDTNCFSVTHSWWSSELITVRAVCSVMSWPSCSRVKWWGLFSDWWVVFQAAIQVQVCSVLEDTTLTQTHGHVLFLCSGCVLVLFNSFFLCVFFTVGVYMVHHPVQFIPSAALLGVLLGGGSKWYQRVQHVSLLTSVLLYIVLE